MRPDDEHVTIDLLRRKKAQHRPITFVTAYDFPTGKLADAAGFDLILVGDTLAETVLGYETTLPVTFESMLHHTAAARRGISRALLVADMPYGTYHVSGDDVLRFAARFIKEAGAQAVKLEGGRKRAGIIRRLIDAEIPMMGHLGLTPQSVHRMGGYKVQARAAADIEELLRDAFALQDAGVFAIVLEGVPREVAKVVSEHMTIPTIGIGAGPDCDGQVLVLHDVLGLTFRRPAKFVRSYLDGSARIGAALAQFRTDIETRAYPTDTESYHLPQELRTVLPEILRRVMASEC